MLQSQCSNQASNWIPLSVHFFSFVRWFFYLAYHKFNQIATCSLFSDLRTTGIYMPESGGTYVWYKNYHVSLSSRWCNDLHLLIFMSLSLSTLSQHWCIWVIEYDRRNYMQLQAFWLSLILSFLSLCLFACVDLQNEVSCHVLGRGLWGKET